MIQKGNGLNYWLMKTEPSVFSISDLKEKGTDSWEGVRNYQVRNFMRDVMKPGDKAIIYHSGKNPEAAGTALIISEGYPDHTAWNSGSRYFDPSSKPDKPTWFMVDVRFESMFEKPVPLKTMRITSGLENLVILKKGNRLSITELTEQEFDIILRLSDK